MKQTKKKIQKKKKNILNLFFANYATKKERFLL